MPALVVVTRPPTHRSGNVAHASATAHRWGQREIGFSKFAICICSGIRKNSERFEFSLKSCDFSYVDANALTATLAADSAAAAAFGDSNRFRLPATRIHTARGKSPAENQSCRGREGSALATPAYWSATGYARPAGQKICCRRSSQ